jgi:hypothetical protein
MSRPIEYRRSAASYRRVHAVPSGEKTAVCGESPKHGFARPEPGPPTCPACRRKLGMGPMPAPRAGAAPVSDLALAAAEALAGAARRHHEYHGTARTSASMMRIIDEQIAADEAEGGGR